MPVQNLLKRIKESLYWKISILFFLILVLLGVSYTVLTISLAKRYSDETTQKLNADVASKMLMEVAPFVNGQVNEEALGKLMHSMNGGKSQLGSLPSGPGREDTFLCCF